jgi:hypothetical protein
LQARTLYRSSQASAIQIIRQVLIVKFQFKLVVYDFDSASAQAPEYGAERNHAYEFER